MHAIQAEEGKGSGHPSEPQPPPSTAQPIHEEPIYNVVSSSHQKTQTPRTKSTAIPNVPLPQGIGAYGSPRCQEATRGPLLRLDDEEDLEDYSKQGRMIEEIDQDAGVTLVTPTHSQEDQPKDQLGVLSAAKVLADAAKKNVNTYTKRRRAVKTCSCGVSTASRLFSSTKESVSTAGASMPVSTAGTVQESVNTAGASMPVSTAGTHRQERDGYETTVRLQEQLDEEERQRIARVHEEASSFNIEEWEDIQATIEANEELA
ncbi:hypothetical protein Tco_1453806 [Tanacetum coccineum]